MKLALKLAVLSAANIGIAFLFQWYVLVQIGPGVETDALFAGMTIPQLVLAIVSGSLVHVMVPLLAGEAEDQLRHDAWGFLVLIGSAAGLLAILLFLAAPWWVPLTVPGFNKTGQLLTIELTRIQLIGMVFASVNGVQWAASYARQQFLWAEFTPLLAGASSFLLLIWALPRFGVVAAAWIASLRVGIQAILLAPRMGHPVRPNLKSEAIREGWQRVKPLLLGTTYYKSDPLIDRFLLSSANSGSLSLYYLAQQMYSAASQVINKAITSPLTPVLSILYKTGNKEGFRRVYHKRLMWVGLMGVAGLLAVALIGQQLFGLVIGHGNVTEKNVAELWWLTLWLGGTFIGGTMGGICSSSFYACGDTVTPTRMSMITYTAYIPSKMAVFYFWGIAGLAITASVYYIVNLSLQIYILEKQLSS